MNENKPKIGELPIDAQHRLRMAAQAGTPGSLVRRAAIDRAYRYIEQHYPEYLKTEEK